MIGAGQLNSRLMLQAPVEAADGQGGVARSFADVGAVWAQVTFAASRESVVAEADGAGQRLRIAVRAPLALSLQHRLVEDDRVYRIIGYRDDGRWVEIDAEMRVG